MIPASVAFARERYRRQCRESGAPCWDEFATVRLPSCVSDTPGLSAFEDVTVLSGEWFVITREFTALDRHVIKWQAASSLYIAGGRPDRRVLIHDRPIETDFHSGFMLGATTNFAHWVFDHLPLLDFYNRVPPDTPILLDRPLQRFQAESLAQLGIPERNLRLLDYPGAFRVPHLWFPILASSIYRPPLTLRRGPVEWLRRRFLDGIEPGPGWRRLFISRHHLPPAKRRLVNHEEVAAVFMDHGFEVVIPEELSFPDQVRLFSEAAVVAGPQGAGFANCVFAPRTSTLIEMMGPWFDSRSRPHSVFAGVNNLLGQRNVRIVGTGAGSGPPAGEFLVDEAYVVAASQVEKVLAGLGL